MDNSSKLKEYIEHLELVGYRDSLGHRLEHDAAFKQIKEVILKDYEIQAQIEKFLKEAQQEGCSTIIESKIYKQPKELKSRLEELGGDQL